ENTIDLGISVIESHERTNYPFTLNVDDFGVDFGLTAQVDKSIGSDRVITYMKEILVQLLEELQKESEVSIDNLGILPKEEEIKLLEDFNATEVDYPKENTIVDLFLEQVSKTPEAIAVIFEGEELSYKELDNRSNQLGHYLQDQGVEPDDLVGICLDRSLEMLIGILGILKSGGAYVPIDPEYPKDRIDYMLDDAGIRLVLSIETSVDVIANREDLSVFMLDRDWSVISDYPTNTPESILCPSHLAYVIYTSGSTGKPKGVLVSHVSLLNFILSMVDRLEMKGIKS
ncbi:AMP-binding protein, partial [Aquimarina muelleri]|uniref:AMP-binding protein n=1 Tax=Aquimarina muelleri TaxID=279356 RepID=UPI0016792F7E